MRSFLGQRQANRERAAGAGGARGIDAAIVRGDDGARDGEPEPGATPVAGARRVEAHKGLEDPLEVGGLHADARVTHGEAGQPASHRSASSTLPPLGVYDTAFSTSFISAR